MKTEMQNWKTKTGCDSEGHTERGSISANCQTKIHLSRIQFQIFIYQKDIYRSQVILRL